MIELLVVVGVLMVLAGAMLRKARPALEIRRVREAARMVNVFCGSARNRAMANGRPCGVMLEPMAGLPQCCMVLSLVEVPPPYAGDTIGAVAQLSAGSGSVTASLSPGINAELVQAGDRVLFNHQGPLYVITSASSNSLSAALYSDQGQLLPWGSASEPVPYTIFRSPRKSASAPLQLPAGAVIDLSVSGPEGSPFSSGGPVIIMFSPTGAVEQICTGADSAPAVRPIFLLVGKRERIPAGSAEDGLDNITDLTNLWVTLNPQTGLVTTAYVGADDPLEFARQADNAGGN